MLAVLARVRVLALLALVIVVLPARVIAPRQVLSPLSLRSAPRPLTPFPFRLRVSVLEMSRPLLPPTSSRVAPVATLVPPLVTPAAGVPSALFLPMRRIPVLTAVAPA